MADTSPVQPRPAAALALVREQDSGIAVCMVRRHAGIAFMPDVYVFPGGSVIALDLALECAPGLCAPIGDAVPALGAGIRAAALRECFEEAGVLLARRHGVLLALSDEEIERFASYRGALNRGDITLETIAARESLVLATDDLLYWAHWITPESLPKRFDTHFFLATMPAGQIAAHDRLETTASIWIAPEEALRLHEEGAFPLAAPTIHHLRALIGLADRDALWAHFEGKPVVTVLPRLVERDGREIVLPGDEA